jgi:hypothetical protein
MMQNYINQLIEDLKAAAKNPPKPTYIEPPPHLEGDPVISELALVPYQTIEELTGIKQEVFPEIIHLRGNQWERVNEAIFKVFDSLNIELVDAPPGIAPEWLYEVLTTNWQHPVQYLPSSGMDLELCTGDPMTCPYGEYCDCGEDFDIFELPEKFSACINRIAQSIDAGFICYLNPETLEMEQIQKSLVDNPGGPKKITGFGFENGKPEHDNWDKCYVFKPLNRHESYKIMEAFAENVGDKILQEELFYALSRENPFADFEHVINIRRQDNNCFFFKMERLEDHVKQIIHDEIYKIGRNENFDDNELPF